MLAKGSFFPDRSALRSATVTISAPLASSALCIACGEENFPVPRIKRERNSRPAIIKGAERPYIRGIRYGWLRRGGKGSSESEAITGAAGLMDYWIGGLLDDWGDPMVGGLGAAGMGLAGKL